MRLFVVAIALVAGAKVWSQDRLYRAAVGETVIAAYKDRAAQTCHKIASRPAKTAANPWITAPAAEVVIGDAAANVAMWDFDNPLWDVRYRHPHLVLTAAGAEPQSCAYDLVAGLATVRRR
ncbi:MAG: hypothetical protein ACT4OU_08590 [Hyphomicrobium sp.]